jgi:hypothetical protein
LNEQVLTKIKQPKKYICLVDFETSHPKKKERQLYLALSLLKCFLINSIEPRQSCLMAILEHTNMVSVLILYGACLAGSAYWAGGTHHTSIK